MQIKQTPSKPNKEDDNESDSYVMPILHIPTKAERKLFQMSVVADNNPVLEKNPNPPAQKILEQKVQPKSKSKVKSDMVNEDDQFLIKKEGKKEKRDILKNEGNNKKEQVNIFKQEIPPPPKVQKRGRPRKETKMSPQVSRQRLENETKRKNKEKDQKMQIQQPQQLSINKAKEVTIKQQPKFNQPNTEKISDKKENTQLVRKQERTEARDTSNVKNIKEVKKVIRRRQSSSSSDSSSSSSSSGSHSSFQRRRHKIQKIKLKLSNTQKIFIWKNRYLRARRKLKQNFIEYKKCPRDHFMRNLIHDGQKSAYRLVCQKCKKDLQKNCLVYWQCDPCRYLICGKCEGFNWNKCPYGHPTMRSSHFRGQKKCNVCLQPKYVGGLTCPCNFDICGNCELKAKRFNQNGQEVISLQSQD